MCGVRRLSVHPVPKFLAQCRLKVGLDLARHSRGDLLLAMAVQIGHVDEFGVSILTRVPEGRWRVGRVSTGWGEAVLGLCGEALAYLAFLGSGKGVTHEIAHFKRLWPEAAAAQPLTVQAVATACRDRRCLVRGTDFQIQVWTALCGIPLGETLTYGALARRLGRPEAARAVGSAVGKNEIAWVIPCHRVLPQSGGPGGYRWGARLKIQLLASEAGQGPSAELKLRQKIVPVFDS